MISRSVSAARCWPRSRMLQAPPAQAQKTLLVAEPQHGIGYLPLYVAIRNGYFAKQGLDVKAMTVDGGSTHTNAVLTGQAFAFIGGPEHNAYAKLKGGELRAVVNVVDRGNVYFTCPQGQRAEARPVTDGVLQGQVVRDRTLWRHARTRSRAIWSRRRSSI